MAWKLYRVPQADHLHCRFTGEYSRFHSMSGTMLQDELQHQNVHSKQL